MGAVTQPASAYCSLAMIPERQGLDPTNHHLSSSGNNGTPKGLTVYPNIAPTLPRNLATQTACPLARDRLMVALGCISISNQACFRAKNHAMDHV